MKAHNNIWNSVLSLMDGDGIEDGVKFARKLRKFKHSSKTNDLTDAPKPKRKKRSRNIFKKIGRAFKKVGRALKKVGNAFKKIGQKLMKPFAKLMEPFAKLMKPFAKLMKPFAKLMKPFAKLMKPFAKLMKPFMKLIPFPKLLMMGTGIGMLGNIVSLMRIASKAISIKKSVASE